jgi:hypothetical protein
MESVAKTSADPLNEPRSYILSRTVLSFKSNEGWKYVQGNKAHNHHHKRDINAKKNLVRYLGRGSTF